MRTPAPSARPGFHDSLKLIVAATPLIGSLAVPLLVPVLMVRVGIGTGVLAAVLLSCCWFVLMLRTSELPSHD